MRSIVVVTTKDLLAYFHYIPIYVVAVKSGTNRVSNFPIFPVAAISLYGFETKPKEKEKEK